MIRNKFLKSVYKEENTEDEVEVKPEVEVEVKPEVKVEEGSDIKPRIQSSWVHKKIKNKKSQRKSAYNFDCRNPLHADAEYQDFWELLFLKQSFHPSVSLFAHQVSNATAIKYSGDPLLDFTTSRYLDRFVYRNPKKITEIFHSDPQNRIFGPRKFKISKKMPVLTQEYTQQKETRVPVEERFIYHFLQNRPLKQGTKKHDSDLESIASDEFEKLLDEVHHEGEDVLNFAKELGLHKLKKGAKKKNVSDDDVSDNLSDEEIEELDMDEDDDLGDGFEDLDNEDLSICDEDFIENDHYEPKKKKKTNRLRDDLLADADEFAALLEESGSGALDNITSETFQNKDKASVKQLQWEMERDRFVRGKRKTKSWGGKSKKFRKS
ncbi:hypothetical protein TNIN_28211 [Trichonephila inaurata madagascariensis]|uniref:CCAAT-binding factor domain-containing protein n=1 Tax=Trichonephila inaurata madagascariensis TaxID=2747483 RepID=A0A8X6XSC4_9ARAC|nr:hypothetical protein TNIN_28211 [Trichonephila inaurata madagascariensis]